MKKNCHRVVGAAAALLAALSLAASTATAQELTDTVATVSYIRVKPEQTNAWLVTFKENLVPVLEELEEEGPLLGWHLFVPGLHHPGSAWTHMLVLGHRNRAAQGEVEKRLREAIRNMPEGAARMFYGAMDLSQHFDDEWREIDFESLPVPEEPEEKEAEEEGNH
ncbi:MAG: hypothetical protein ACE5G6_06240 [Terriglobia bacterium]